MTFRSKPNDDGSTSLNMPDGTKISNPSPVKEPTLAEAAFDPFAEFKTDEENYHYRALNVRPHNMRERQAQGYETIPNSEYGDLILAKIPREVHEKREAKEARRTKERTDAVKTKYEEEAQKMGVKTFEV